MSRKSSKNWAPSPTTLLGAHWASRKTFGNCKLTGESGQLLLDLILKHGPILHHKLHPPEFLDVL